MNVEFRLLIPSLALGLALAGCAAPLPGPADSAMPDEWTLLSGEALFGAPVVESELPDADLRGLDEEMRDFVAGAVAGADTRDARLLGLLRAMLGSGMFALDYEGETTLTAREAFNARAGNCLSFTNLFVALAREAGLPAYYQEVDIPALWTGDSDTSVLIQHVNVLVRDSARGRDPTRDQVVDFNLPSYRGLYPQRVISDSRLDALFYNNLGAAALRSGMTRDAFVYFLKALTQDPDVAAAWSNLGVLYYRNGLPGHAESAFHRALRTDPGHKPSLSNLARLYEQQGMAQLAAAYSDRVRRHQLRNPYYHLHLAERALEAGRPEDALAAINQAIRLRSDEHRFHYLRAVILAREGRLDASRASLRRARDTAPVAQLQSAYERKLEALQH